LRIVREVKDLFVLLVVWFSTSVKNRPTGTDLAASMATKSIILPEESALQLFDYECKGWHHPAELSHSSDVRESSLASLCLLDS
jgi:hypothetical protein